MSKPIDLFKLPPKEAERIAYIEGQPELAKLFDRLDRMHRQLADAVVPENQYVGWSNHHGKH